LGRVTDVRRVHPENAELYIIAIPAGRVMDVNAVQLENNSCAIKVMPVGRVTDVRDVFLNALYPIVVTVLGMVMDVSELQFSNAEFRILVRLSGRVIDVKRVHPANVLSPITEMPAGNVTDVRALQPKNAESPIIVIPLGIATPVILVFPLKAPLPISLTGIPCIVAGIFTVVILPTYFVITAPVLSAVKITSKSASLFCAHICAAVVTVNNINISMVYVFFIKTPSYCVSPLRSIIKINIKNRCSRIRRTPAFFLWT
jgi:hypothetical protein